MELRFGRLQTRHMKRLLKFLHEIGAVGVVVSFAAIIVLVASAPSPSEALLAYAAVRQCVSCLARWLLVPSLSIVLISGLLAIAANESYKKCRVGVAQRAALREHVRRHVVDRWCGCPPSRGALRAGDRGAAELQRAC
jgi:hypothetical protein